MKNYKNTFVQDVMSGKVKLANIKTKTIFAIICSSLMTLLFISSFVINFTTDPTQTHEEFIWIARALVGGFTLAFYIYLGACIKEKGRLRVEKKRLKGKNDRK